MARPPHSDNDLVSKRQVATAIENHHNVHIAPLLAALVMEVEELRALVKATPPTSEAA